MTGVLVALITVLLAILILFFDKIGGLFNSKKNQNINIEDDFDLVMSEADNSGFYSRND